MLWQTVCEALTVIAWAKVQFLQEDDILTIYFLQCSHLALAYSYTLPTTIAYQLILLTATRRENARNTIKIVASR